MEAEILLMATRNPGFKSPVEVGVVYLPLF